MSKQPKLSPILFIRDLMKGKSEKEILEAEQNFREYILIVKGICERIRREKEVNKDIDSTDNIK